MNKQQPRRPYVGANVRYQAGPTTMPGYSHAATVVSVGYLGWKKDDAYKPDWGEVLVGFPGGDPVVDGDWLEVCKLAVFMPREMQYTDLIPYSPRPSPQHWNWPEANTNYPCSRCGWVPGRAPDSCPNCGL